MNMESTQLQALHVFIARASKATYASGGGKTKSQRKGFIELEYREGDWCYRDSYTGFLRSWGQEVVWYKNKPIWTCLYGGGMSKRYMDSTIATETFTFLKKALLSGGKGSAFQPRGPKSFASNAWSYRCEFSGDITKFSGEEFIYKEKLIVFTHSFIGGIVIDLDGRV